jgi:two-component system chemotaxis response regulator CheB
MDKLKALVVDDSVLYRKILTDILSTFSDVEVIGSAHNGKAALQKIKDLKPDLVTLDFEMPELNGIQTLREIKKISSDVKSVMVSAHTQAGAKITMEALEEGAFDFIAKPNTQNLAENKNTLRRQLQPIINVVSVKVRLKGKKVAPTPITRATPAPLPTPRRQVAPTPITQRMKAMMSGKVEAVGIGISTGGPNALTHVIPKLPENFKVPVLIVQHMPPLFTSALADSLNKKSRITVQEAKEGMPILPGNVYIAPGGKQMKIEKNGAQTVARITDDAPENNCKPAADYLFRSIAKLYKGNALGVIMTGMGSDGTKGLIIMKKLGSKIIAQDERTCTVFGMPMEAMRAGVVDVMAPLQKIADEIMSSVK